MKRRGPKVQSRGTVWADKMLLQEGVVSISGMGRKRIDQQAPLRMFPLCSKTAAADGFAEAGMWSFECVHGAIFDELERQGAFGVDSVMLAAALIERFKIREPVREQVGNPRCVNGFCDE